MISSSIHRFLLPLLAMICFALPHRARAAAPRVIVPPQRAQAQPTKEDKARAAKAYKAASRWHSARRFKRALPYARTIWRSVPKRRSAEIYAAVLEELGRHCESFEVLLAATDLPEEGDAASKTFVPALNRAAARCTPASGWARITVTPSNAVVTLSSIRIVAPRTVGLSPGEHSLVVSAAGYEPTTQRLSVIAGVGSTFHVSLNKLSAPTVDRPPEVKVKPDVKVEPSTASVNLKMSRPQNVVDNTAGYALVGTGSVLTAAGVGLFVGAILDRDDHETLVMNNPAPSQAVRDEMDTVEDRGRILEIAAYVGAGVGLATLVTGVVLLATSGSDSQGDGGSVDVGATWGPSGASLRLTGRF